MFLYCLIIQLCVFLSFQHIQYLPFETHRFIPHFFCEVCVACLFNFCVLCFLFLLCLFCVLCLMLPVSLQCPFLIAPSVLSNVSLRQFIKKISPGFHRIPHLSSLNCKCAALCQIIFTEHSLFVS